MSYVSLLRAELLKLKRLPVTWVLAIIYSIAPLMVGFMMAVLKNPDLASKMGLLTAKAEMTIGGADWPTYLMISGYLFAGGMIVICIIVAFIFGREYVEGTAKYMLTLPVDRLAIVAAKLTVCSLWFVAMAALVYGEAVGVGVILHLPGLRPGMLGDLAILCVKLVGEVLLVSSVYAWITVATRGYLAPVGLSVLLLLIGDLFAHTGWGAWVPWSIVLLTANVGGTDAPVVRSSSIIVLVVCFLAGGAATWLTLDRVDNTQ
jgi:ABC-type transport system involved in multi-copper enzyme maturation permease subunit